MCGICMIVAFLIGQSFAIGHAYEHLDEAPHHNGCEVCVLAINNNSDSDIEDYDGSDDGNFKVLWGDFERKTLFKPQKKLRFLRSTISIDPPPKPYIRLNSVRAPPPYV